MNNKYTPIIGLEVHVELKTASKMFCGCSADYFGQQPNSHTCPVCLGLPGALPVPNAQAIEWCIKIALALNCEISPFSKFDRKNYFYPDLAKGYQISQFDLPFGRNGFITLKNGQKKRIHRVHMEEDTAKLSHQAGESLIDFNRSGVPLVEIVTEADFRNGQEVKEYLQQLQQTVRYLDVSNADMDKGNMRLEPNISLILTDQLIEPLPVDQLPKYKVEVKNINSFRFVEKAIDYETVRQQVILETGTLPLQETRGWNETKNATVSQRIKEEANDYRYFPEPDIPPFRHSDDQISKIKDEVPELQDSKMTRFCKQYELSLYDAEILTRDVTGAEYFESAVKLGVTEKISPKQIANAIINKRLATDSVSPEELIHSIKSTSQVTPINEVLLQVSIKTALETNEKAVQDYKNGKETVIMYLVGQVMKIYQQKIDAQIVKKKLEEVLKG